MISFLIFPLFDPVSFFVYLSFIHFIHNCFHLSLTLHLIPFLFYTKSQPKTKSLQQSWMHIKSTHKFGHSFFIFFPITLFLPCLLADSIPFVLRIFIFAVDQLFYFLQLRCFLLNPLSTQFYFFHSLSFQSSNSIHQPTCTSYQPILSHHLLLSLHNYTYPTYVHILS